MQNTSGEMSLSLIDVILSFLFTGQKKEACWEIRNCMISFFISFF